VQHALPADCAPASRLPWPRPRRRGTRGADRLRARGPGSPAGERRSITVAVDMSRLLWVRLIAEQTTSIADGDKLLVRASHAPNPPRALTSTPSPPSAPR
jgi:hypothetical protein